MDRSSEVLNILENYGYKVRMTTPEQLHHNPPSYSPHKYKGEVLHIIV